MRNVIKLAMSVMLAVGCAYVAKSQACAGKNNTIPEKETSSALGADNSVYGKSSAAIGQLNTVSVSTSTNPAYAIGYNNSATAKLSFAIGDHNNVSQIYSFAFGQNNIVSDGYSFAIGTDNKVNANTSIAVGYYLKNTKKYSMTIGMGKNQNIPLVNNTNGIMMGMYSDIPTLFISRSADAGKTGKVGIGNVTNPKAKLHIKADNYSYDGEDADILLEPTRTDKKAAVYFIDTIHYISVAANNGIMKFEADKYIFNGNAAIGDKRSPSAKLHIFGLKGEDANIYIQPTDNAKNAGILFRNTSNKISVGPDNVMGFAASGFNFNTQKAMTMNVGSAAFTSGEAVAFTAGSCDFTTKGVMSMNVGSAAITSGEAVSLTAPSCSLNISKVGIGCVNNVEGFALAVKGGVVSTEMSVMDVDLWPDFVFSSDYNRMSLYELERYISQNHHLPEIPSAEEVSENGINLGEMNALLLQKVEELTLHVIELQKQIDAQQDKINAQQSEIDELKSK